MRMRKGCFIWTRMSLSIMIRSTWFFFSRYFFFIDLRAKRRPLSLCLTRLTFAYDPFPITDRELYSYRESLLFSIVVDALFK